MNTRTLITTSAIALTLGLTGCASQAASSIPSPTASVTATPITEDVYDQDVEDLSLLMDYRGTVGDISAFLDDLQNAAGDMAEIMDLGSDLVVIAKEGLELEDIPDAGSVANDAWDEAMNDYIVVGSFLQVGMLKTAGDSLDSATENIEIAAAALNPTP